MSDRACGARIVSRTDELREEDMGTGAGLFEVKKIGDEYFTFVTECKDPKACTILLRGASKEILAVRLMIIDYWSCSASSGVVLDNSVVCSGGGEEPAGRHAGVSECSTGALPVARRWRRRDGCVQASDRALPRSHWHRTVAIPCCCPGTGGHPPNTDPELWRLHHPSADITEGTEIYSKLY